MSSISRWLKVLIQLLDQNATKLKIFFKLFFFVFKTRCALWTHNQKMSHSLTRVFILHDFLHYSYLNILKVYWIMPISTHLHFIPQKNTYTSACEHKKYRALFISVMIKLNLHLLLFYYTRIPMEYTNPIHCRARNYSEIKRNEIQFKRLSAVGK